MRGDDAAGLEGDAAHLDGVVGEGRLPRADGGGVVGGGDRLEDEFVVLSPVQGGEAHGEHCRCMHLHPTQTLSVKYCHID